MTGTGEFSEKGKGLDNHAQYRSPDGKLFATAYIYRPGYPDAALTAYATDRAVKGRFGPAVRLASQTVVPLGGRAGGAIRSIYEGGVADGEGVATAAAFARVGEWIVKLRATGPAARAGEVVAALDALIAGVETPADVRVHAVQPLRVQGPCPAANERKAKPIDSRTAGLSGLAGALIAATEGSVTASNEQPAFPANGAAAVCVRATSPTGDAPLDLLQPAGESGRHMIAVVLNDAGGLFTVTGSPFGKGYTVRTYAVGVAETRGTLDRLPTAEQVARWLGGADDRALRVRSRTRFAANGDTNIELDPADLK